MDNDWRITNQKQYLLHAKIKLQKFISTKKWDHAHCVFCWEKFLDGDSGYATQDGKSWVCKKCYLDFKEDFFWV